MEKLIFGILLALGLLSPTLSLLQVLDVVELGKLGDKGITLAMIAYCYMISYHYYKLAKSLIDSKKGKG